MQLIFLGTSASEGYPDAFCGCANCEMSRKVGGRSLRKRSAALIDRELLLDFGPDLTAASMQHGISLARVRYCLQTHEHADHLDPVNFMSRSPYCGVHDAPRLHYFASQNAMERCMRILRDDESEPGFLDGTARERLNLEVHAVEPFRTFDVGPYRVTSLQANHAPETTAMLYLIERDGSAVFYGTDTGELPQATWNALQEYGTPCNLVILEHTFGFSGRADGHLNWEQFLEQIARMRELDMLTTDARIVATHIGHHSNPVHSELAIFAQEHGYEVAYDGLVIDF